MANGGAGAFEFRGRAYRFDEARGFWEPGDLVIEATGKRCGLRLVGIPFPGVSDPAQLPGRVWEPEGEELARYADTFAEGELDVRGPSNTLLSGRIECRSYDPAEEVLTLSFRLDVLLDESGESEEAVGVVHCKL